MIDIRQLVHAEQMVLFGPSPAERERQRREVLEGRFGMPARDRLVRRDRGRYIEPEYEPPLQNPWRREPTPTPPPRPRRMYFAKPAKPFSQMTDAEIEDFAKQFMRGMAEQREAPTGQDRQPGK